jgi:SAM-dependent methyltransferase
MMDKITSAELKEKLSEQELRPYNLLGGQEEAFARDIERLKARRKEFVAVPCPACNSSAFTSAYEKFSFQYVICKDCKTIYMSPRPSVEVMSAYYSNSENYQYWAKYMFPSSEEARREKVHRPWLQRIVDYCNKFGISRSSLLEVGPGFGTFAALAQESRQFEHVIAVEPTPEMAEACRTRGVNVINKRIEDIKDEVDKVGVAVAFEAIEHIFEPRIFIQQCARLLQTGGLLVLSCPNGQGFDISTLKEVSRTVDAEHVNLFNPQSLSSMVESCGFETLEISTPGRLDAELVRKAILDGQFDVSDNPFLKRVLIDEWDRLGWKFQEFLAVNGLSSHMWLAAQKK